MIRDLLSRIFSRRNPPPAPQESVLVTHLYGIIHEVHQDHIVVQIPGLYRQNPDGSLTPGLMHCDTVRDMRPGYDPADQIKITAPVDKSQVWDIQHA